MSRNDAGVLSQDGHDNGVKVQGDVVAEVSVSAMPGFPAFIRIENWKKHNPRPDVTRSSWFRLEHSIVMSPDWDHFDAQEIMVWIALLSQASLANKGAFRFNAVRVAQLARADIEKVRSAIDKLKEMRCIVLSDRICDEADTPAVRERSITDERTDERTKEKEREALACAREERKEPDSPPQRAPAPPNRDEQRALPLFTEADIDRLVLQWDKTLAHFKAGRETWPNERKKIAEMLASGVNQAELCHALSGMRYEPAGNGYDPAKHIKIARLWDEDFRIKMATLSTQEAARRAKSAKPTLVGAAPPEARAAPDAVKNLVAQTLRVIHSQPPDGDL